MENINVDHLFSRWASVGVYVPGEIHPFEDPEVLVIDTLIHIEKEGRLLGILTSWLSKYGHLLLTKKLRFPSNRERRLFSAIIEESQTGEPKLLRMVQRSSVRKTEHVYRNEMDVLKRVAEKDPNPRFLRHGFILKNFTLLRPDKIVLSPSGVYERSTILRYRALHGATLRSDLLSVLPGSSGQSVRQVALRLHVAPPTLERIIDDYVRSGLVERIRKGRSSFIRWCDPAISQAA